MNSNTDTRHSFWLIALVESILFAFRLLQHLYANRTHWRFWLDMELFGILMFLLFLAAAATGTLVESFTQQLVLYGITAVLYLFFGFLWYTFKPH